MRKCRKSRPRNLPNWHSSSMDGGRCCRRLPPGVRDLKLRASRSGKDRHYNAAAPSSVDRLQEPNPLPRASADLPVTPALGGNPCREAERLSSDFVRHHEPVCGLTRAASWEGTGSDLAPQCLSFHAIAILCLGGSRSRMLVNLPDYLDHGNPGDLDGGFCSPR